MAHEVEKDYMDGTKTPLKLAQLQANLGNLPEDMKTSYSVMSRVYQENPVRVDRTLTDGEKLPYAGGITIIHTPGHTLGHISLYLEASKTLVSGDELRIENGVLGIPPERINHDTAEVVRSLKKLSQYDIERVICYHGGLYQNQPSQRIAELVQA
jgi:glyoxylase-like metal-dependent hydrolase (beta-lactamase superfamily II)